MMVLLMNPLIYHTSLKDDVEKQYDGCDVHVVAHGQWDVYEVCEGCCCTICTKMYVCMHAFTRLRYFFDV